MIRVCPGTCRDLEDRLGNAGLVTKGGAELVLRWAAQGRDKDGEPVALSPRARAMLRGVADAGGRVQAVHRALSPCPGGCCPQPAPEQAWRRWWRRWWRVDPPRGGPR